MDFGAHRWLSGDREEAYSDWLGWIVEQLQTAEMVFQLFGVEDSEGMAKCQGVPAEVSREEWVPRGHEEQAGRLDLVIRYEDKALIVVEVKLVEADQADTAKQSGYSESIHTFAGPDRHKHRVLVTLEARREGYEDFRARSWAETCIELRRLIPDLRANRRLVVAAMILAFVGAVEQNILGFPFVPKRDLGRNDPGWPVSEMVEHIRRGLSHKDVHDG